MAAFKVRRQVLGTGGGRLGSQASYTDFTAASGRQLMVGGARVWKDLWVPAVQWYGVEANQWANVHGGAATVGTGSPNVAVPFDWYGGKSGSTNNASRINLPVLAPSAAENTDMRAATVFVVPPDAASTGNVYATLYFTENATYDTTGCMEAFRLRWHYLGSKGKNTGGASGSLLYGASLLTTGSGAMEIHAIGSLNSFSQASPFVVLELGVENSSASAYAAAPGECIFGLKLRYLTDVIGGSAYDV